MSFKVTLKASLKVCNNLFLNYPLIVGNSYNIFGKAAFGLGS